MRKRIIYLALLLPILCACTIMLVDANRGQLPSLQNPPPTPHTEATEWKLIFQDEFEEDSIAEDKWVRCYWWGNEGCTISTNAELEWYLPENVTVEDGSLKLQARAESVIAPSGEPFSYTSGMVTTGRETYERTLPPQFVFQYGYAEIRAKVPKGQGLWSAFWLLPEYHRATPEIDVLEILGHNPNEIYMFLHYLNENGEYVADGESFTGPDFSAEWHTFSVDWSPQAIVWFVDDVEYRRIDDPELVPATPMYLILNLAVGGEWPGAPDATTPFPSNYEIDYVRVWSRHITTNLAPVAAAYVDAAAPDMSFPSPEQLVVDDEPAKTAYLAFDATALAEQAIDSATLRIWTSGDPGMQLTGEYNVHLVEDELWDEADLTYENRPQISEAPVGSLYSAGTDEIYDIRLDVDQLQPYIGQIFSIALVSPEGDLLSFYSGKQSDYHVRLSLTSLSSEPGDDPESPLLHGQ